MMKKNIHTYTPPMFSVCVHYYYYSPGSTHDVTRVMASISGLSTHPIHNSFGISGGLQFSQHSKAIL